MRMFKEFYRPGNVIKTAAYYLGTAGVVAATVTLAPTWALIASGVLFAGITAASKKAMSDNNFHKSLKRHPESHPDSPNLGKIARELYQKTGLSAKNYPIYDFKSNSTHDKQSQTGWMFNKMAHIPNAAALGTNQETVILISEPLLKLLNDAEEKSVLAHEFVHAAAKHNRSSFLPKMVGDASGFAGLLTQVGMLFTIGWNAAYSVLIGQFLGNQWFNFTNPKKAEILRQDNDNLSISQIQQKKGFSAIKSAYAEVVQTTLLAVVSPLYLKVYAAFKGLSLFNKLASAAFSRNHEIQADRGATTVLGADPLALATALRKMESVMESSLEKANGGKLPKPGFLSRVWKQATSTHPSVKSRVKKLGNIARKQGRSEDEIQAAISGPLDIAPGNELSESTLRTIMAI